MSKRDELAKAYAELVTKHLADEDIRLVRYTRARGSFINGFNSCLELVFEALEEWSQDPDIQGGDETDELRRVNFESQRAFILERLK